MFKVNNKDSRTVPLSKLWTYFTPQSSVSIVNFEYAIASWETGSKISLSYIRKRKINNRKPLQQDQT